MGGRAGQTAECPVRKVILFSLIHILTEETRRTESTFRRFIYVLEKFKSQRRQKTGQKYMVFFFFILFKGRALV